jgi:hypothetical protein
MLSPTPAFSARHLPPVSSFRRLFMMQNKQDYSLSLRDWAATERRQRSYTDEEMRRKLIWQLKRIAMRLNADTMTLDAMRELVCDEIIRLYGTDAERMQHDMQNIVGWYNYSKAYVPEYEPVFPLWLAEMIDERTNSSTDRGA